MMRRESNPIGREIRKIETVKKIPAGTKNIDESVSVAIMKNSDAMANRKIMKADVDSRGLKNFWESFAIIRD